MYETIRGNISHWRVLSAGSKQADISIFKKLKQENMKKILLVFTIVFCFQYIPAQTSSLTVKTYVSEEVKDDFLSSGRIFLFVSSGQMSEPRRNTWPNSSNMIFAANIENWKTGKNFTFDSSTELSKSVEVSLARLPEGNYTIQVLWDQDRQESGLNAQETCTANRCGLN
jgi:hypothetical protein